MQTWTGEQQNELARYGAELQNSTQSFTSERGISEDKRLRFDAMLKEATADMQALLQTEQNKLAKYGSELQLYGGELAVYQADSATKLQQYQSDLQAKSVEYQWLQDQYQRLKIEYEKAFAIAQPQPQT